MYQQALQNAKQTGDMSKQRRLDRGLKVSEVVCVCVCVCVLFVVGVEK